jgi:hypothetical protein
MARPTKYDGSPEWLEMVTNYCLLGCTDVRLAQILEVTETTINNWKAEHKEFLVSIKDGRDKADALVSKSLYSQALDGNVRAQEIWLRNRQRDTWTETKKVELSGEVTGFKIDLDNG